MGVVLRTSIAAFEGCAVDTYRALRSSWFVGLGLLIFYFASISIGLLIGAIAFEAVQPIILIVTAELSPGARQSFELSSLFLFLYSASLITCSLARLLVQFAAYLLYEIRGPAFFFLILLTTIICALIALGAGIFPLVLQEQILVQIAGSSGSCAILFGFLAAWIQVRYRSNRSYRVRNFEHDIGIALDHMTDARRARFSFYRNGM
jgi:hypothetical protein